MRRNEPAIIAISLLLLFALTGALAVKARGDELAVYGGHWSKHFVSDDILCDTHRWVGVRYNSWTAGYYRNSYCRDTVYIGKVWDRPLVRIQGGAVLLRAGAGVNYGYTAFYGDDPGAPKRVLPYLVGGLIYQRSWWEVGAVGQGDALLGTAGVRHEW